MPLGISIIAISAATVFLSIRAHNESLRNTVNTHQLLRNFDIPLPPHSKKGDHLNKVQAANAALLESRQSSTTKVEGKKGADNDDADDGNEDNAMQAELNQLHLEMQTKLKPTTTEPELLHVPKLQEADAIDLHSHSAVIGAGNNNKERNSSSSSTRNSDSENVPEISPLDLFVPLPLPSKVPDSIPANFRVQEQATNSKNSTPPSIWFDALDTRGHRGYVADPTLLRRSVLQWHKEHPHANYWDRVQNYQSHLLREAADTSFAVAKLAN